jgi:hypothetical protein
MGASAPSSVVGSLFGEQYPQTQGGGSRGGVADSNPGWSGLSDSQKASFYANNPTMSSLTQGLQGMFGNTALGALQNKLFPNFVKDQQLMAMGINPTPTGTLADMGIMNQVQDPMQAAQAAAISRDLGGNLSGGYTGSSGYSGDNSGDNRGWGSRDAG